MIADPSRSLLNIIFKVIIQVFPCEYNIERLGEWWVDVQIKTPHVTPGNSSIISEKLVNHVRIVGKHYVRLLDNKMV